MHLSGNNFRGYLTGVNAQEFPIKEDRLIELAKEFFRNKNGILKEDMLAPDFRFEFQVISLDRKVRCSKCNGI